MLIILFSDQLVTCCQQQTSCWIISSCSEHNDVTLNFMLFWSSSSWVRTRWALLVVFWLGWLGMLGGAVLIVLRAPRCRDLPATNWWNHGPLYQVGDIRAFSAARNLKGEDGQRSHCILGDQGHQDC